jgi:MYXO-CTERM domain-containing protein
VLSSFVRLDDGTLLVGAILDPEGRLYRSRDGGRSFTKLPASLRPRALATRGGKLYAATDNTLDGFALAVSDNQGDGWRRVMAFSNIESISRCGSLPFVCVNDCAMLACKGLVKPGLCQSAVPAGKTTGNPAFCETPKKAGCQYRSSGANPGVPVLIVALALLAARRRRRPG